MSIRHCVLLFGHYQDTFCRFTTVKRVKLTHPSQSSAEVMNVCSCTAASTCPQGAVHNKNQVNFSCSDIHTARGCTVKFGIQYIYRSQWPRGLRRGSAVARLLGLWVRIPPGAWMFVCCECCVLSDRGLCDVSLFQLCLSAV